MYEQSRFHDEALLFWIALGVATQLHGRKSDRRLKPADAKSTRRKPAGRLIRTVRDAELVVAEWMQYLGFADARATPTGADFGIDVEARQAVAQVKMEGLPTGRPAVQALFGAATGEGKQGFFFSLAGYTNEAIGWGEKVGVPMFTFNLQGEPEAVNEPARKALRGSRSPSA